MIYKLYVSILVCLMVRQSQCQSSDPSCPVKVYIPELEAALENLGESSFAEPGIDGMDALFTALRSGEDTELVILLDISLEVRPNHFYLVNKPLVDTLLKYHVDNEKVSVSLIQFGESEVSVICKEVLGDCAKLEQCIQPTAYASNHTNGWVGTALVKSLSEASAIFEQTSKADKQKIILLVSGFQITQFFIQELEAKKKNVTALGVDIYTVLSSFRNRFGAAGILASTPEKFQNDASFVTKLYNTVPLQDKSCTGVTTIEEDDNRICKDSEDGNEICMCKLGYNGANCEIPPDYCSFPTACPTGSVCTPSSEMGVLEYTCSCPQCVGPEVCLNFKPAIQPTRMPSPGDQPGAMTPTPPREGNGPVPRPSTPAPDLPMPPSPTPPRDLPLPPSPTPPRDLPLEPSPTPPRDVPLEPSPSPPRDVPLEPSPTPTRDLPPSPSPPSDRAPQSPPPPQEGAPPSPAPTRDEQQTPTPPRDVPPGGPSPPSPRDGPPTSTPPRDLPPPQVQPDLPSMNQLLNYINILLERARACIYPNSDTSDNMVQT